MTFDYLNMAAEDVEQIAISRLECACIANGHELADESFEVVLFVYGWYDTGGLHNIKNIR